MIVQMQYDCSSFITWSIGLTTWPVTTLQTRGGYFYISATALMMKFDEILVGWNLQHLQMFIFRKIRRALFSWNTRFEIRLFTLLPTYWCRCYVICIKQQVNRFLLILLIHWPNSCSSLFSIQLYTQCFCLV